MELLWGRLGLYFLCIMALVKDLFDPYLLFMISPNLKVFYVKLIY